MAQFFVGLEDTPWSGCTLTGVVPLGPRVALSPRSFDACTSLDGWTNVYGTSPALDPRGFRFTSPGILNSTTLLLSGDFDLRADFDLLRGSSAIFRLCAAFNDGNYIFVDRDGGSTALRITGSAIVGSSVITSDAWGILRLTRTGNNFVASFGSYRMGEWIPIASTTQGYGTTGYAQISDRETNPSDVTCRWVRDAIPTGLTGTIETAVLDTVDGLRGIGWFTLPGGTGTGVTVQYRTGLSVAACAAATYQPAVAWKSITPQPENRHVQVLVTITGAAGQGSPEFGPLLIDGTADPASLDQVTRRLAASLIRHTLYNRIYAGTHYETINDGAGTRHWQRAAYGLGRLAAARGTTSFTCEGQSYDYGPTLVAGMDQFLTDQLDGVVQIETANYLLSGLYAGRQQLLPLLTSAQKASWLATIQADLGNVALLNYNAFAIVNRSMLTALESADPGSWATYADSASETNWTVLEQGYVGSGWWDDGAGSGGGHLDNYSHTIAQTLAITAAARPGHVHAADFIARLQARAHATGSMSGPDGTDLLWGRSVHASSVIFPGLTLLLAAELAGGSYGVARHAVSRCLWTLMRQCYLYGADLIPSYQGRKSLYGGEFYAYPALTSANVLSTLAAELSSTELWAATDTPTVGDSGIEGANVEPSVAVAIVTGPPGSDPMLMLQGAASDPGGYVTDYAPRVISPRFGLPAKQIDTNIPSPQAWDLVYTRSTGSTGNRCSLQRPSAATSIHAGKGAFLWRTGHPNEFSATVPGTATTDTLTSCWYARGHHATVATKLDLAAGVAASGYGYTSPPIPVPTASLGNPLATDTYAYGEAQDGTLSAQVTALTANLQGTGIPRTAVNPYPDLPSQGNRLDVGGLSMDLYQPAAVAAGTTVYAAADLALSHGPMTPATEGAFIADFNISGDVVTYTIDPGGTPEVVYMGLSPQALSSQSVGSYTITGPNVRAFAGRASSPTWWGGSDLTTVSFDGQVLGSLATAGNLSMLRGLTALGRPLIRVVCNHAATITDVALGAMPSKVYAYAWDGSRVDVTSRCSLGADGITIPADVVSDYGFGVSQFDVEAGNVRARRGLSPRPGCRGAF